MTIKHLFIVFLFFSFGSLKAQIHEIITCDNDTIFLHLNSHHGQVHWQSSADTTIWQNITPASDTLRIVSSPALLYRAIVVDGTCDSVASDTTRVKFFPVPTVANAGPDQLGLNNVTTTLAANTATIGTGTWQILSGTGGTITSLTNPTSTFKGVGASTYKLVWKIENACKNTKDTVLISFAMPQVTCNGSVMYVYPVDNSGGAIWGCSGTVTNATSLTNGELNTTKIDTVCTDPTIAAHICNNLTAYGFSDWYLPSIDELNCIYTNKNAIGGFPAMSGIVYWSSTETNAQWANAQDFSTGTASTINQKGGAGILGGACRVRCVRR